MEGWIKLHREILEWEWYDEPNVFRLYLHCLLKANHASKEWRGTVIERGSFITSLQNLSIETKLSVQQVRTCLKKLTKELTVKSTTQYTVIQVVKYNEYQDDNKQTNKRITNEQQTDNNQITTTKNDNNNNNEKNKAKPRSVEQVFEYMTEINYPDAKFNSGQFFNHYEANGWMRGRAGKQPIKDWRAVVRTWMGRVKKDDKLVKDEYGSVVGQKTDYAALAKYYGITEEEARKHYKPIN